MDNITLVNKTIMDGDFLPKGGGSLTGHLSGTSATFSGQIKSNSRDVVEVSHLTEATRASLEALISELSGAIMLYELTFTAAESPDGSSNTAWTGTLIKPYTNFYTLEVYRTVIQDDTTTVPTIYFCTGNLVGSSTRWSDWQKIQTNVDVVNNLTSTNTDKPLSAAQGKALNDKFGSYLPLTGGTMTGSIVPSLGITTPAVAPNVDNNNIIFCGGTGWQKGGYLWLHGKDNDNGGFELGASNGTLDKRLIGKKDGTLTWNGSNVMRAYNLGSLSYISGITNGTVLDASYVMQLSTELYWVVLLIDGVSANVGETQIGTNFKLNGTSINCWNCLAGNHHNGSRFTPCNGVIVNGGLWISCTEAGTGQLRLSGMVRT